MITKHLYFCYRAVSLNDSPEVCVNGACGPVDEVYDNLWDKSDLYAKVRTVFM